MSEFWFLVFFTWVNLAGQLQVGRHLSCPETDVDADADADKTRGDPNAKLEKNSKTLIKPNV